MKINSIYLGLALLGFTLTSSSLAAGKLSTVGEVTGSVTLDPAVLAPGTFDYEYEASGEITNLGHVDFLIFGTSTVDAMLNITPNPPTTFIAVGEDGDAIIGIIRWKSVASGATGYSFEGTYTISGGTGKFSKAKGEGVGTGLLNVTTLEFKLEVEGTITQPKVTKVPKVKPPKGKK